MAKADDLISRWRKARSGKSTWHRDWEDLARVMLPRRMGFLSGHANGDKRTEDIFDGTPMQAARGLANAVAGFIRPEGEQWVFLHADDDAVDESEEAQAWLAAAEQRLIEAIYNPHARFRQATGEVDLDMAVFGTGIMFIGESQSKRHLLFQSLHLKDGAVVWGDEGEPQGMFREKEFTVTQAAQRFGLNNLSREVREKFGSDKGDEKLKILHAVTLRDEGRPDALFSRDMPWGDHWVEIDSKHQVEEGGFFEFPFAVPRWDTSSGEDYGRSPGMIALPDSNALQAVGETMLIAGQRSADPSLAVPNDGAFTEYNTFPGGLVYYDIETAAQIGGSPFFPIETGANMPLTRDMQLDTRDQIFRAFFKNILNLPVEGPQMTATEVIQRKEEFIREIGPVFGRLESDYTAPIVERAFQIMLRSGSFGEIPEVLQGTNVVFEYESPVKRIREQVQASAAHLWAMEQFAMAEIDPRAADVVNAEGLGRFKHEALGLPLEVINSAEAVEAIAQARAQAQQQAAQMAAVEQGAGIADTASSAISKVTE